MASTVLTAGCDLDGADRGVPHPCIEHDGLASLREWAEASPIIVLGSVRGTAIAEDPSSARGVSETATLAVAEYLRGAGPAELAVRDPCGASDTVSQGFLLGRPALFFVEPGDEEYLVRRPGDSQCLPSGGDSMIEYPAGRDGSRGGELLWHDVRCGSMWVRFDDAVAATRELLEDGSAETLDADAYFF